MKLWEVMKINSWKKILGIKKMIEEVRKNLSGLDINKLKMLRKDLGQAYKDKEIY